MALIAPLCRVLGCTADELLGIGDRQKDELIKAAREAIREGRAGDAVSLYRQALAIAPKDFRLMVELCDAMRSGDGSPDTLREVVRLLENAVGSCEDDNLNAHLYTALSLALNDLGEREAALRAAESLPDMFGRHSLFAEISRGQARVDFGAVPIYVEVDGLCRLLVMLAEDTPFSAEEKICLLQKGLSLYRVFYEDGDFCHVYGKISEIYWRIALLRLESEKREEAMGALAECVRYAVLKDGQKGSVSYSSILFRRMQYHAGYPSERETCARLVSDLREHPDLAPLRDRDDFKAFIAELETMTENGKEAAL